MANLNISQLPALTGIPEDNALFIMQAGASTFRVTGLQLRQAYGGGGGGSGGVQSVQPGTGIAVDNTDPANPIVSATGGGGGGNGTVQFVQVGKLSPGATLTGAEIMGAGATPFVLSNQEQIELLLNDLNGSYLVVFRAFLNPLTLLNPSGSNIFDQSGTPVSQIVVAPNQLVQMILTGGGGSWSGYVLTRY